jgi:hypothetical protein
VVGEEAAAAEADEIEAGAAWLSPDRGEVVELELELKEEPSMMSGASAGW